MDASPFGSHPSLRRPAWLLLGGPLTHLLVTRLHAGRDANDHHAIFEDHIHDATWRRAGWRAPGASRPRGRWQSCWPGSRAWGMVRLLLVGSVAPGSRIECPA